MGLLRVIPSSAMLDDTGKKWTGRTYNVRRRGAGEIVLDERKREREREREIQIGKRKRKKMHMVSVCVVGWMGGWVIACWLLVGWLRLWL